jgi:hypothetical protein
MCICHRGHRTPKNLNNNRETGQENHGSTPFGENISKDGGPGPGYKNHNVTRNKTKIRQLAINVLPVQKTIYLSKMQKYRVGYPPPYAMHMPPLSDICIVRSPDKSCQYPCETRGCNKSEFLGFWSSCHITPDEHCNQISICKWTKINVFPYLCKFSRTKLLGQLQL